MKVINCDCGEVVRAESDEELAATLERHNDETHPDQIGGLSRKDILARATWVSPAILAGP